MPGVRAIVRAVHRWLGLAVGGLFVVFGLSGSLLVFYEAIDAALHPEIRVAADGPAPGWDSPVWDRALRTVRERWPERDGAWRFEVTGQAGAIPARYQPPDAGHHGRRIMVWLSPDGTRVLREAEWGGYAMTWLYDLHMRLLLHEGGHALVGWTGVAVTLLLLAGLAAWWPRGSWQRALHFKRGAVPTRRLRDVHKLAGLVALPLLLMLAVTGAMLALPVQSDALLARTLGAPARAPAVQALHGSGPNVPLARALAVAREALPASRLAWVEAPGPGTGAVLVRVQQPGDPSRRFPHSYVWVDPRSAAVLAVHDRERLGVASKVNNWLHPLHDASAGGLVLRGLVALVGLVPALLFATGLWRWQQLRVARRRS